MFYSSGRIALHSQVYVFATHVIHRTAVYIIHPQNTKYEIAVVQLCGNCKPLTFDAKQCDLFYYLALPYIYIYIYINTYIYITLLSSCSRTNSSILCVLCPYMYGYFVNISRSRSKVQTDRQKTTVITIGSRSIATRSL